MMVFPRRSFSDTSLPFSSGRVKSGALSLTFMQMPNVKSELNRDGSRLKSGRPAFWKILHRRIFYRWMALVAVLCVTGSVSSFAQEERPQIVPGERKARKKKDAGPRAVGVLQMTANGKASLVPIAILINGKFWDASAYKADPVPMALDSGTVYEGERAGNSLGLFTVSSALHRNSAADNAQAPWIGAGAWRANGAEPEKKPAKAEAVPVGIDTSEGPPRLTRDTTTKDKRASAAPPPTNAPTGSGSPSSTAPKSTGSSGSGDEPPRLSKPASSSEPPAGAAPSGGDKTDPGKASESKAENQAKVPASDSGASEGSRPKLRRGKPAESFADEDVPGYSKVGAKPPSGDLSKAGPIATLGDVQLIPAISDAGGP